MAVTPLCSTSDLQDRLSAAGVALRVDDNPPSVNGGAITRGSIWVYKYLQRRYTPANIAQSDQAIQYAADIATFLLCTRRGNPAPAPIAQAFKMAADEMKEIRIGSADLFDVPARRQSCPVMSNIHVPLQPQPHARVTRQRSTTTGGAASDYVQTADLSNITEQYLNWPAGA